MLYNDIGNYHEALEDFNKAIDINPKHADAYNNRGATYKALNKYDEALKDYSTAIEINSKYADAYCNRGDIYRYREEYLEALKDYSTAIGIKRYYLYYVRRGEVYFQCEKYDKALQDYNKAIKINPKSAQAYLNLIELKIVTNDYMEALKEATNALPLTSGKEEEETILYYFTFIAQKILDIDTAESESKLSTILKQDFVINWNFDCFESWFENADIPNSSKVAIKEKTALIKAKKK